MMRAVLALLFVWLVTAGMLGCGCKPHPQDHPDFHEETLKDPSKIPQPGRGGQIDRPPMDEAPDE